MLPPGHPVGLRRPQRWTRSPPTLHLAFFLEAKESPIQTGGPWARCCPGFCPRAAPGMVQVKVKGSCGPVEVKDLPPWQQGQKVQGPG